MNRHGTAIVLGSFGLFIEGPSGSGKTALALAAISQFKARGHFAALVADDQCIFTRANDRLIAACPLSLRGIAEVRGVGIIKHQTRSPAIIDYGINLVEAGDIERMPQAKDTIIAGVKLTAFDVPQRQIAVSLPILCHIIENRRF